MVSPSHEVFGIEDLYIADGSVVPSSIAVNPQQTIMAMATFSPRRRTQAGFPGAATILRQLIEGPSRKRVAPLSMVLHLVL